nr:MAG TPA: Protein of unknown function (DUF551) [Bacteriophage sp.]
MTREEIVKALRCCNSDDGCRGCPLEMADLPQGTCVDKVLFAAADLLEQDAKTGWISVKDRLPEHGKQVLLIAYGWSDTTVYIGQLKHTDAETSWLTGFTSKESEWCIQGWSYLKEPLVTHWMPLPEPPEEGK